MTMISNPIKGMIESLNSVRDKGVEHTKRTAFIRLIAHMIYICVEWSDADKNRSSIDWSMAEALFARVKAMDGGEATIDQWVDHLDTDEGCHSLLDGIWALIAEAHEIGNFKAPYADMRQVSFYLTRLRICSIIGGAER